jgi:2-amino-4-hydroxy-6-hydroxymethyldihydropteridine diphosphokinase
MDMPSLLDQTETPEVIAYIGLGSNQGDRLDYLRRACSALTAIPGIHIEADSRIYESESVEGGGPNNFLNAVIRIRTTLPAAELLAALLVVEVSLGRPMPPRTGPRVIDLDLLLYGDARIETPLLTVPHPRMGDRLFVLLPLCDVLVSGWVRPTSDILSP